MSDRLEKNERPKKAPVDMTSDELMDHLFSPKVREELKKMAHDARPNRPKQR